MNATIARLWIALIDSAASWSAATRLRVATVVGDLASLVVLRRLRIAEANLRTCFPQMTARERRTLVRRLFRNIARAALDYGVLWKGSLPVVRDFVRIEGMEHLRENAQQPLLVLAPHFVGLDLGGIRLLSEMRGVSIYARQSNPVWDHWLQRVRSRFGDPLLIARRSGDLRSAIRAMRAGLPFYYLPDMDTGDSNSIFVPFFGVDAATLPFVSRLARSTGAKVMMIVTEQTPGGYLVHIEAPWTEFPGVSVEEDTARMNREIERWVLRLPDQYLWTHRRFKTRPKGAASIY